MKIALCLEYLVDRSGGVEVLVSQLVRGLAGTHEIILVSPDEPAAFSASALAPLVRTHISSPLIANSSRRARALADRIAEARPDIVHFHLGGNYGWNNRVPFGSPIYYLGRRGIPCLTTSHLVMTLTEGYCGPQKPFWFKLAMLPLVWCGKLQQLYYVRREIAVSVDGCRKMRRWYWPLRDRYLQIYHSRLPADASPGAEIREKVILNVGHIAERKGQHLLAEAFAGMAERWPDWTLWLAGQDEDGTGEKIRQFARSRGLESRIQLLGRRTDAADLMRRAAIYVQPSFWEGMPLALQEAMFYGCACVGSDIPAHVELMGAGDVGSLFHAGAVPDLARELDRMMADEAMRKKYGAAAAASVRARGMTAEAMIRRHLELYAAIKQGTSLPVP